MAFLHIMSRKFGDKTIVWREDDKSSLEKAREAFKKKLKAGWLAFKLDSKNPSKGKMLKKFDEKADKIILTPPATAG